MKKNTTTFRIGRKVLVSLLAFFPMFIVSRMIRPKHKAKEIAFEKVEKLHDLLKDSPVGSYIIQDNQFVYVNKSFCELLGYRKHEIYQPDFLKETIRGDVYDRVKSNLDQRLKGERVENSYKIPVVRKDKQLRILELFAKLTTIEGKASITGMVTDITERENMKGRLEQSESRYTSLFEHSPESICSFDLDGTFISANPASERILGRSMAELENQSFHSFIYPEDLEKALDYFDRVKKGESQHFEIRVYHGDGRLITLESTYFPMVVNGEIVGIYAAATDITKEKEVGRLLEETKQKFDSLYENTLDAIFEIDDEGNIRRFNKMAEKISGYTKGELDQLAIRDLVTPEDYTTALECFHRVKHGEADRLELMTVGRGGRLLYVDINAVPIYNEDGTVYVMAFVQDITEQKRVEQEMERLAYTDALTGLPNRYMFTNRLAEAIDDAKEQKHTVGILFIDFDNFKTVNDTLGHDVGDQLLQEVVRLMKDCLRNQDIIARQGGDEFLILLEDVSEQELRAISDRLMKIFNEALTLGDHEVFITPSIGISMFPQYGRDAESVIKHADLAMYFAKEKGKNNYQMYTDQLNERMARRHLLQQALRKSLDKQELSLVYQPQFDIATSRLKGMEALLRWNPSFGFVSPAEFIPIAEETGLIVDIGAFVLREACKQNKQWQEQELLQVPIAVNVSARQLKDKKFVDTVVRVLEETQLHPGCLEIEITETVMMDVEEATVVINQLKEIGVKIAIDDFGVGYSSLNMIRDIEFDNLKIDQSFLHDVMKKEKSAGLLEAIIYIGRKIGVEVVVEGVETEDQVNFLTVFGVIGQGYYFARPLPAEGLEAYLKDVHSNG